jgi:putative transposase
MARQARLQAPGLPHLVQQRGHNGAPAFVDDDDRRHYLATLLNMAREHGVEVHAYALAVEQVVLLVTPQQPDSLSQMMQGQGRRYVAWFNLRHQRSGTLWEGRFRSCLVEPGEGLLRAQRYIEAVIGAEQLALNLLDSLGSSAPHHLGALRDPLITDALAHWQLGNTPFEREAAYRLWLEAGVVAQERQAIEAALRSGTPYGGDAFLAQLQQRLGLVVQRRKPGRPPKTI